MFLVLAMSAVLGFLLGSNFSRNSSLLQPPPPRMPHAKFQIPCEPRRSAAGAPFLTLEAGLATAAARVREAFPQRFSRLAVYVQVNETNLAFARNMIVLSNRTVPPLLPLILFHAVDARSRDFLQTQAAALSLFEEPSVGSARELDAVHRIVSLGYDVLLMSVRTIVLRNPLNHLADSTSCDITVGLGPDANSSLVLAWNDTGRLGSHGLPLRANSGFMLWRSAPSSMAFLGKFLKQPGLDFDRFLATEFRGIQPKNFRAFSGDRVRYSKCILWGPVTVHVLPPCYFATMDHLRQHVPQVVAVQPYVLFPDVAVENGVARLDDAELRAGALDTTWGWDQLWAA
jgi:hypothetical protein